jgi:vitamin B12 transporter
MSFRFFVRLPSRRCAASCLFSAVLLHGAVGARAQVPGADSATPSIVITATRTPIKASDAVAEVTVLDRAALDRAAGRTLVELLTQQPGLQFSSSGGVGKTSSLFIRGLEARHTMLLVDGVRIFSATVGTPALDNLPLEAIDRIEIVRGPMSALYGNGAVGGVIQVFTRRGTKGLTANAKVTIGSNDRVLASGGVGFGAGAFDIAAQAQGLSTRGVSATNPSVPFGSYNPDRDGFEQQGGSLRLGWQAGGDWRLEALALESRGLGGVDDGPGANAQARLATRVAALSAAGTVLPGWKTRLATSHATDIYDTLSSASAFTTLGAIATAQKQLAWENTLATPLGTLLALADRLEERVSKPGAPFDVNDRHIDGLALGLDGAAAGHVWQASLRRDRNSQFGSANTGALGWGFALLPALRVGASVGSSYVAPSFNQLFYPNFGNPNLVPEEGRHAELNVRYTADDHALRLAVFDNRYRGFITSGPQPLNLPEARIKGLTLAYEGRWHDWALSASIDHTDPRNTSMGTPNFDKVLPRRAKDIARLGADWEAGHWSAGATLGAFSHRFDNTTNTTVLGGYATLDMRAEWPVAPDLVLGAKLNNVGNKAFETALGYDQPGREGFLTLRWALR